MKATYSTQSQWCCTDFEAGTLFFPAFFLDSIWLKQQLLCLSHSLCLISLVILPLLSLFFLFPPLALFVLPLLPGVFLHSSTFRWAESRLSPSSALTQVHSCRWLPPDFNTQHADQYTQLWHAADRIPYTQSNLCTGINHTLAKTDTNRRYTWVWTHIVRQTLAHKHMHTCCLIPALSHSFSLIQQ